MLFFVVVFTNLFSKYNLCDCTTHKGRGEHYQITFDLGSIMNHLDRIIFGIYNSLIVETESLSTLNYFMVEMNYLDGIMYHLDKVSSLIKGNISTESCIT